MNLAFVVGMQGRTTEAENLVKADLPVADATANVAELKGLLARHDKGLGSGLGSAADKVVAAAHSD
jgi:Flp pilus assembly protein TadD